MLWRLHLSLGLKQVLRSKITSCLSWGYMIAWIKTFSEWTNEIWISNLSSTHSYIEIASQGPLLCFFWCSLSGPDLHEFIVFYKWKMPEPTSLMFQRLIHLKKISVRKVVILLSLYFEYVIWNKVSHNFCHNPKYICLFGR